MSVTSQMLRILVVDDDEQRRKRVVEAVVSASAGYPLKIVEAAALAPAKGALAGDVFDVLILDLALPRRVGEPVLRDGGVQLLAEVEESEFLKVPTHIVAITGFEEIHAELAEKLGPRSVGLHRTDIAGDGWVDDLKDALNRFLAAKKDLTASNRSSLYDVAIVCALPDPELESVLDLQWNWATARFDHDSTVYHQGRARTKSGERRIIAAAAPRMGMPATAGLAAKMIAEFRPQLVAMVGIAAGYAPRARMGDVLVPDPSWDCGSGKWAVVDGRITFLQAPHQLALDNGVRESVRLVARDTVALAGIRAKWRGPKPENELRVITGPVASNAAVLADGESIKNIATYQHRELIGLEMEAYGVFAAVEAACLPKPQVVVLKSVVDYADVDKKDDFRSYGAYTSAQTLRLLVEEYL